MSMDLDSSANKLCFTKLKKDFISPGKLDEEPILVVGGNIINP